MEFNESGAKMWIRECKVPDLKALDDVIYEGYDPNALGGPTYYRVTKSWYYYKILTEFGVILGIGDSPELYG